MSAATIPWEQYQKLPPDQRRRPLTDAEYAALTKQQRVAAGLDEDEQGAPTDFNGPVFPNPTHIQPRLDTDPAIAPTRLPEGVTFQHGNFSGTPQMDVSNPAAADVQPAMGREVQTKMSAQPIDFSKYEQAPGIDFSKYEGQPAQQAGQGQPPQKTFWDHVEEKLPGSDETGLKGAVNHIQDTLHFLKGAYDVSAPGIAQEIYKKLSGQPNELKQLPGKMVTAFALGEEPEFAPESAAAPAAEQAAEAQPGMLSRAGEVAKRRITDNPLVRAAKDVKYVLHGAGEEAPAAIEPPIPANWGKGVYGTPVDQWGQRIQPGTAGSMAESVAAPKPTVTPAQVESSLNDALGGQKLQPGVSLRNQPAAMAAARGKLPEGFTPVNSSVLKGYKYDPDAQEFTAITQNGQSYTHGEVTSDQVAAFEKSPSQGKAWTSEIRNNNVLVRKNGQPVRPVRPEPEPAAEAPASPDLTQQLQDSLDAVRSKKASGTASARGQQPSGDVNSIFNRLVKGEAGQAGLPGSVTNADEGIADIQNQPVLAKKTGQVPARGFLNQVGADRASVLKTPRDLASVFYHRQQIAQNGPPDVELHLDEGGNVIGAQGRHRAVAAIDQGGPNAKVNVTIFKHPYQNPE